MKNAADAMFSPQIFTSGGCLLHYWANAYLLLPIIGVDGDVLEPDDVVVDVGGSVGSVTLTLLRAFPKLRYVVQDLERQIAAGERVVSLSSSEFLLLMIT